MNELLSSLKLRWLYHLLLSTMTTLCIITLLRNSYLFACNIDFVKRNVFKGSKGREYSLNFWSLI